MNYNIEDTEKIVTRYFANQSQDIPKRHINE